MEAPGGEGKAEVLWPQLTIDRVSIFSRPQKRPRATTSRLRGMHVTDLVRAKPLYVT